ncbi:MAG: hypothetical protein G8237_13180 [Magnetococcales bacterium]|nr:hypothetical protein [Magnetococcales bacterium]NGZ07297.1 hypothetical protein [Magnetococcales bacterium]
MDHTPNMDINGQKELAIRLGVQAHLAFRRHSAARITAIRDGSWLETTAQSILFRLQAEYDSQQEEYRKALHALREAAPDEYSSLLKEIAQQIREEVNEAAAMSESLSDASMDS